MNAMDSAVDKLQKNVESARRSGQYADMDTYTAQLGALLQSDTSPEAAKARSLLNYEKHMAAFQQAESRLKEARQHAEAAVQEAQTAGDKASELFAKMVLGGHTLPALREGRQAIQLLAEVCSDAETVLTTTTDATEHDRFQRILMNCYWHQILLAIEYRGDKNDVKGWKAKLESNPTFQQYRNTVGAKVLVDAQSYIDT